LLRGAGETFGLATTLYAHGLVLVAEGERDRGRAELLEALQRHVAAGDVSGVVDTLDALSELAVEEGRPERAVRLAAAADAMRGSLRARASSSIVGEWDARTAVRGDLSEEAAAAAWAEGQALGRARG